jgi:choline dehydrogenase-like flavoprotein
MGALRGPAFLLKRRLANSSRHVGLGLRIHPATRVVAEFDEIIDGHIGLPQGAYVDHWTDRGVMLEGIFLHPGVLIASMDISGYELKEIAAAYRRMSAFGVMVTDTSVGRILPGRFGAPFTALYQINMEDTLSMRFGIARLAEIYLAAGAKKVFTGFYPMPVVENAKDLLRFEAASLKTSDIEIMAFHPLGTCKMGADPKKSVVNFDLESHDIRNMYIMDGSVVPGSLGVNPQITIMSLALRAAGTLADKIK